MLGNDSMASMSVLRVGLVFFTGFVAFLNYYSFCHFLYEPHGDLGGHNDEEQMDSNGGKGSIDNGDGDDSNHGQNNLVDDDSLEDIYMKKDDLLLYGLALPLMLLTLASLIWNRNTNAKNQKNDETSPKKKISGVGLCPVRNCSGGGDVNIQKWTFVWLLLPLLYVFVDSSQERYHGDLDWWNALCIAFMSPTGYAAVWALAAFLIPVANHSPILDWLRITPVQALAFHRVAGWTSLWNSIFHGFLQLRYCMNKRSGPWYEKLVILLIPSSRECITSQNPWEVFFIGREDQSSRPLIDDQCRLALVNATGMISVLAFIILAITSLPRVRRSSYTLFYRVHIPAAWIMLTMAILHYPVCGLILIPNIIYYISFKIPKYMSQCMDYWGRLIYKTNASNKMNRTTPLVEATLIQGGSIELTFASVPDKSCRHGSRFMKVSHFSTSPISHPFSAFSRQDLIHNRPAGNNSITPGVGDVADSSHNTISIILRSTGVFTKGLTAVLFPDHENDNGDLNTKQESVTSSPRPKPRVGGDSEVELIAFSSDPLLKHKMPPSSLVLSPHDIMVDSFYAGSYDWVNSAMTHDKILLVAGGVGIVSFLDFLPSLQERIQADSAAASTKRHGYDSTIGPSQINLHWYCRDVGLASYVWHNHLRNHVHKAWEKNPSCRGRLKIHLHLTSLSDTSSPPAASDEETSTFTGVEIFANVPNTGILKKACAGEGYTILPVQDSRIVQSRWLGLLLSGGIMTAGIMLHWWWYKQYIIDDKFRHDNLSIRSHSIVFTLILASAASFLVEVYSRHRDRKNTVKQAYHILHENDSQGTFAPATSIAQQDERTIMKADNDEPMMVSNTVLLSVSEGRPPVETLIKDTMKADRPGVYMCGPRPLMKAVEDSIPRKRTDCVFYREDSEL